MIDWDDPADNSFSSPRNPRCCRTPGTHHRPPDLVCYVNGLPLVVIEAKRPESGNPNKTWSTRASARTSAIRRTTRFRGCSPTRSCCCRSAGTDGRYATTKTPKKFWASWREESSTRRTSAPSRTALCTGTHGRAVRRQPPGAARVLREPVVGAELPTDQDRLLIGLLDAGAAAGVRALLHSLRSQGRQDRRALPAGLRHQER